MTEKTIKSYTEKGVRIQLVEITTEDIGSDGMPTSLTKVIYQVRKNRKIRLTTENYKSACNSFQSIINYHVNQLNLF